MRDLVIENEKTPHGPSPVSAACYALEALFFVCDRPLSVKQIVEVFAEEDYGEEYILTLLEELKDKLERDSGLELVERAQGYQVVTKEHYAHYIAKLVPASKVQLSPSALEVLTITAYRAPITKSEIDSIRGVDSSHLIRRLLDVKMITVCGQGEGLGRPALYATTKDFLDFFGLTSLEDLPQEQALKDAIAAQEIGGDFSLSDLMKRGSFSGVFDEDSQEELNELTAKIRGAMTETDFTKALKQKDQDPQKEVSAFDVVENFLNPEADLSTLNVSEETSLPQ